MEALRSSFENFLDSIGSFLPGVLGALIILFIGWLIASGLRKLTYRLLKKTKLDDRLFAGNANPGFSSD